MQLKRLELAQVRAFEQATFEFQPGMNLLVGINGAGKSTVLDVLCILLSQTLPKFTAARIKPAGFTADDIRVGRESLTARLTFSAVATEFDYLVHLPRFDYQSDPSRAGQVRGQTYDLPTRADLTVTPANLPKNLSRQAEQPLALYFSTRRSLASMAGPSKASTAPGQAAAFAEALSSRELRLREFADWWLAQDALARETGQPRFGRNLDVLSETVVRFLDDSTNLRAVAKPVPTLLIDKPNGPLDVRQLSDGERSMIALVLDLAKRLAQANPKLADPLRNGQAVVLIDEIDLHLHPGWQRTIVEKLTATFPRCQFIATTHSPQIIGEVRQDRIQIIADGQVYSPTHSFGVDSSRILEEILDVPARTQKVDALLGRISRAIGDEQVSAAKQMLTELTTIVGENDADVIRVRTLIEFMEDEE